MKRTPFGACANTLVGGMAGIESTATSANTLGIRSPTTCASPLYRNHDGTWPKTPKGHKLGDRYVATRDGRNVQWKRLYRPLELRNEDEVLVFLVAHEAFHYLRRTRQVEGRHGEIEADAFALKTLEQDREQANT